MRNKHIILKIILVSVAVLVSTAYHTITCSLHFDQLWVPEKITISEESFPDKESALYLPVGIKINI